MVYPAKWKKLNLSKGMEEMNRLYTERGSEFGDTSYFWKLDLKKTKKARVYTLESRNQRAEDLKMPRDSKEQECEILLFGNQRIKEALHAGTSEPQIHLFPHYGPGHPHLWQQSFSLPTLPQYWRVREKISNGNKWKGHFSGRESCQTSWFQSNHSMVKARIRSSILCHAQNFFKSFTIIQL